MVEKLYSGYGEMSDEIMCNETQSLGFKCDELSRRSYLTLGIQLCREGPKWMRFLRRGCMQEKGSLIDARGREAGFSISFYPVRF